MTDPKDSLGFSLDLSWSVMLDGKPWDAALPSKLEDARLEHLWAGCQPQSKCRPLAHLLISHLIRGRTGMTREQFLASPPGQYAQVEEEFVKLVNAERNARLAEQCFLAVFGGVCDLAVVAPADQSGKECEVDHDAPYRAAYENDEPSMRIKRLRETFERIKNGSNSG